MTRNNAYIEDSEPYHAESSWFVSEPRPLEKYEGMYEYSVKFQKGGYGKCGTHTMTVADNILQKDWADLIAAAPELLDALQEWLCADNSESASGRKLAKEKARIAVAKVTGKSTI
jgi:hypothetical protein